MKIIRYVNSADLTVEFQDEYKFQTNATYNNFIRGIKNPYDISVSTRGYIGEGKHLSKIDDIVTPIYANWRNMLKRCYDESDRYLNPAYENCEVCKEWYNFQNFAQWYDENFYDCGEGRMHIDKDILVKNNKIYSPETCIFVPQRINMIFMTKGRKDDLPTGIRQNPSGSYTSHYNGVRYGTYETLDKAVAEHEKQKRIHIKEVIKEYGNKLPDKVINALLAW